jgi:hypothetical protein
MCVRQNDDWQVLPTWRGPLKGGKPIRVFGRFVPALMSISDLPIVLTRARGGDDQWWDPALPALLALLQGITWYLTYETDNGWISLVRYGYVSLGGDTLARMLEHSLPQIRNTIDVMFPTSCPMDAAAAIEVLQTIKAGAWPLLPGPVLRRGENYILIDLQAATQRLNRMLAITPADDKVPNARARHFEDVVQHMIDGTPWAPHPMLRALQRRTLHPEAGVDLTDIDALGEFQGTLLIVSCKSTPYRAEYEAGDYRAVRNVRTMLIEALNDWLEVIEALNEKLVGTNYDLRRFERICGVVCTPHVFYVPVGSATRPVLTSPRGTELIAVCSYGELERFLSDQDRG